MSDSPKVNRDGMALAVSDDGRRVKRVRAGDDPGPGWWLVTEDVFDALLAALGDPAVRDELATRGEHN